MPASALISLQEITKNYSLGEQTVEALRGVSLEVPRNQFVAIMGASGSGKSTLLNLVGCLDQPTTGTYLLDGVDVSNLSSPQRADIRNLKIGFVFQNFNLLPRTTVWENIEAPMLYAAIPKNEREHRTQEALQIVGIPGKGPGPTQPTLRWPTTKSSRGPSSGESSTSLAGRRAHGKLGQRDFP